MAANSSSSSVSVFSEMLHCYNTTVARTSILIITSTNLLVLLPLYVFIICLLLQRWRHQRPGATSQTDVFTYNMVATELMGVFGSSLICCGVFVQLPLVIMIGDTNFSINIGGQVLFHTLTCVERYLAVVHPITYRNLGTAKGIMIRNFSIACAWIVIFIWMSLMFVRNQLIVLAFTLCAVCSALAAILFCSLSVLYALIRPGPGEVGGARQRLDQSKLKAFSTIVSILVVLLPRFGLTVVACSLYMLPQEEVRCGMLHLRIWLGLPNSLLSSLLFLHRAGKLPQIFGCMLQHKHSLS
ncbi:uncharacterized protein V6R79_020770 [Siganus canaliculatus]